MKLKTKINGVDSLQIILSKSKAVSITPASSRSKTVSCAKSVSESACARICGRTYKIFIKNEVIKNG